MCIISHFSSLVGKSVGPYHAPCFKGSWSVRMVSHSDHTQKQWSHSCTWVWLKIGYSPKIRQNLQMKGNFLGNLNYGKKYEVSWPPSDLGQPFSNQPAGKPGIRGLGACGFSQISQVSVSTQTQDKAPWASATEADPMISHAPEKVLKKAIVLEGAFHEFHMYLGPSHRGVVMIFQCQVTIGYSRISTSLTWIHAPIYIHVLRMFGWFMMILDGAPNKNADFPLPWTTIIHYILCFPEVIISSEDDPT